MAKRKSSRRRRKNLGSSDRFVVSGPATWRRSVHTTKSAAVDQAKACSKRHPNAICKVTEGLPGMQRTIAECNRSECYAVSGGMGKRRRRRKARR